MRLTIKELIKELKKLPKESVANVNLDMNELIAISIEIEDPNDVSVLCDTIYDDVSDDEFEVVRHESISFKEVKNDNNWISFNDKKPEIGQNIICLRTLAHYIPDLYGVYIGDNGDKINGIKCVPYPDYPGLNEYLYGFTHWKPLPEPPKVQE